MNQLRRNDGLVNIFSGGSLSEALRNEAEIWRLTQIINGIQAAIDPNRTLTQAELVGRAWELAKSADPITEKQARNKV